MLPPEQFKCAQCGSCCLNSNAYYTNVTEEDIEMWVENERYDILDWVDPICFEYPLKKPFSWKNFRDHDIVCFDIWISPKTGDDVDRCPWLRKIPNKNKYKCRIHDVKPGFCRDFPDTVKRARKFHCKGLIE